MNKRHCNQCGKENPNKNKFCSNCGNELTDNKDSKSNYTEAEKTDENKKSFSFPFLFVGIVAIILMFVFYTKKDNETYKVENTFEEEESFGLYNDAQSIDSAPKPIEEDKKSQRIEKKEESQTLQEKKEKNSSSNMKFTFRSTLSDHERNGRILETFRAETFHVINFNNKTVRLHYQADNGEQVYNEFHFDGFYTEEALLATTYVLKVGNNGVKEIWWNSVKGNIGYDYTDGNRMVFYELTEVY